MERSSGKMSMLGAMIAALGGRVVGQAQSRGAIVAPGRRGGGVRKRRAGTGKSGKRFGRERSWRGGL